MAKEIERKYLIREGGVIYTTNHFINIYPNVMSLQDDVLKHGKQIIQGYLPVEKGLELIMMLGMNLEFKPEEARLRSKEEKFYLTVKGNGGVSRNELESEISKPVFDENWALTDGKRIEKIRLVMPYNAHKVEFDVYTDGRDLIVAEIEVPTIEIANSLIPFGKDISDNSKYKNKNLAR